MIDTSFHKARTRVLSEISLSSGIGTLSEKSLHRMIKLFIEEDESFHEVEFLGSVADIKRENQIYEIQTHSAERLVPKLKKFFPKRRIPTKTDQKKQKKMLSLELFQHQQFILAYHQKKLIRLL